MKQEIIASLFTSEESAEIDTLTEPSSLLPFTVNILALPRYFNSSCWRLAESETKLLEQSKTGVTRKGLEAAWQTLRKACGRSLFYETVKDDGASFADSRAGEQIIGDIETVAFYVTMDPDRLRTCDGKQTRRRSCPEKSNWVGWDDLELVING